MENFNKFIGALQNSEFSWLNDLLQFFVWAFLIFLFGWLIRKGIQKTVKDPILIYRTNKLTNYIGLFLIVFLGIFSFFGDVKYFTIAIGIASAGFALGLQEVILSVAGWVSILTSNLYKTGDRVENNQVKGDVIDIGITKTTLMEIGGWVGSDNYNGRITQVSNSFVFKGVVHNYSTDFPFVWDEINLPVQYGSDIKLTESIIRQIADKYLSNYAQFAKKEWKQLVK